MMDQNNNEYCAPDKETNKYTCFSLKALKKIATALNKEDHNTKGDVIDKSLINTNDNDENKYRLWKVIKEKLINNIPCDKDYCWTDNKTIKKMDDMEIEYETFRPKKPGSWYDNKKAWLSTTDIQQVLLQYENKHSDFIFIGPVPIDFDKKVSVGGCIVDELCNLDIGKLYKSGKRKLGVVFNLDPHDMPGSHWVSLFVNMSNGGIYFHDSVGKFPNTEISNLMFRIRKQGNKLIKQGDIKFEDLDSTHDIVKPVQSAGENKYKIISRSKVPKFLEGMTIKLYEDDNFSGGSDNIIIIKEIDNEHIILDSKINHSNYNNMVVKGFRLFYNDISHQQENTECGVYSIHFIESLLNGDSFHNYTKNIIRDKKMNSNRNRLYRPSKHV